MTRRERAFEELLREERATARERRRLRRYETMYLVACGVAGLLCVYAFTMVQP